MVGLKVVAVNTTKMSKIKVSVTLVNMETDPRRPGSI